MTYKVKADFEVGRMCSADKAVNARLTQSHEQTMGDIADALIELQNEVFALGYLRAQSEATEEIARLKNELASVPIESLWRHWRDNYLISIHPYTAEERRIDFENILAWFSGWLLMEAQK